MKQLLTLIMLLINLLTYSSDNKNNLIIAAASSLKDVLYKSINDFKIIYPDAELTPVIAASGVLKAQILNGAPVDLFLFASMEDGKDLVNSGFCRTQNLKFLCSNTLALVINSNSDLQDFKGFESLLNSNIKKIAIGNIKSVPAGKYAEAALTELKLFDKIKEKLIYSESVRQALTYIEMGEADAGIIFKTDALVSSKVKIIAETDTGKNNKIRYCIGTTKTGENKDSANDFIKFMTGEKGKNILQTYGFKIN